MNFVELKVGGSYPGTYPIPESIKFDMTNAGGQLVICFANPTNEEIESIKSGKIKLGLLEKDGVIFLFFKFGNLAWMDAPYNVKLSKNLEMLPASEGIGYSIYITFINSLNGIIKVIRLFGSSTKFSTDFKKLADDQKNSIADYSASLTDICNNYSTEQLLKYANIY